MQPIVNHVINYIYVTSPLLQKGVWLLVQSLNNNYSAQIKQSDKLCSVCIKVQLWKLVSVPHWSLNGSL